MMTRPAGRARISCIPCRKRKSKCDEQMPCSSCVLRRTEDRCDLPDGSPSPVPRRARHHHLPLVSVDLQARKRSRPSPNRGRRSTVSVTESASATGPTAEFESIRNGLARLEAMFRAQAGSASATPPIHSSPLPHRLEHLDEVLAILPCQSDCEILIEYLLQEADWMVVSISHQLLHPIWSRFVYGGRVTHSESVLLVAVIAVAALLLNEGPHIYYSTAAPLAPLHGVLIRHVFDYLATQRAATPVSSTSAAQFFPRDSLHELLIFALTFDYLPSAGQGRPQDWPLVKDYMYEIIETSGFMDERSAFWQDVSDAEGECARRLVWRFVIWERWFSMYVKRGSGSPILAADVTVEYPRWTSPPLSAPFQAVPSRTVVCEEESSQSRPVAFKVATTRVPRVFRLKQPHEVDEIPVLWELITGLSAHVAAVSDYVSDLEALRSRARGSLPVGHASEALLHRCMRLCNDIRQWQHSVSVQEKCHEPDHVDASDYFACRKASQASFLQVGCRQVLNILLSAWVTEETSMGMEELGSPLLVQLQRAAFKTAKEAVRSIEVTRTLLSCGKVIQMPWAATAFFNAATTLAIPLLSAYRGDAVVNDANAKEVPPRTGSKARDTTSRHAASTATPTSAHSVLSIEEIRTLAPDILRILEILPLCKASPLGAEARQRLAMLVDTYGISHKHSLPQEEPLPPAVSDILGAPTSRSAIGVGGDCNAALSNGHLPQASASQSADFGSVGMWKDARGYTVLDSLVALDDAWWEQLLSSGSDAGAP